MENIVTENQTSRVIADKILANDKCLRKTVGRWLLSVSEVNAIVCAIAK